MDKSQRFRPVVSVGRNLTGIGVFICLWALTSIAAGEAPIASSDPDLSGLIRVVSSPWSQLEAFEVIYDYDYWSNLPTDAVVPPEDVQPNPGISRHVAFRLKPTFAAYQGNPDSGRPGHDLNHRRFVDGLSYSYQGTTRATPDLTIAPGDLWTYSGDEYVRVTPLASFPDPLPNALGSFLCRTAPGAPAGKVLVMLPIPIASESRSRCTLFRFDRNTGQIEYVECRPYGEPRLRLEVREWSEAQVDGLRWPLVVDRITHQEDGSSIIARMTVRHLAFNEHVDASLFVPPGLLPGTIVFDRVANLQYEVD